jgi:hypothetical protein
LFQKVFTTGRGYSILVQRQGERKKGLIPMVPVAHLKKLFSFITDKGLKSLESLTSLL